MGLRVKRRLSWHHPAIYLLLLVAFLIYLIVAMIVRKTATVEVGLCETHMAKRRKGIVITLLLVLVGIGGLGAAVALNDGTYALLGVVLLLAGVIYGVVAVRVLVPAKIDDRFVWLKGVNEDYLNELPPWPGN